MPMPTTRGDHKEDRQQRAQLGIADAKILLQPGEQRRQQQLAEVADAMGQADQADGQRVLAQRRRGVGGMGCGMGCGAGHGGDGRPGAAPIQPPM